MRILHTSDWHLGHRLYEAVQLEEQQLFLDYLIKVIDKEAVDVLIVSGDIFDQALPSSAAQKLYYDFLIRLSSTGCQYAVITAGNHDAPGTINAPRTLLESLSVYVVGKAATEVEEELFQFEVKGEHLLVAAVPYLRDQDIRRAIAGEGITDISERYTQALIKHYKALGEACEKLKKDDSFVLGMGHLFAVGAECSGSEQTIYVGNLGDISVKDMPSVFHYLALGHLHRPQKVGGLDHVRYSGSPIPLNFSELNYDKYLLLLETKGAEIKEIRELKVPLFRPMYKISGDLETCKQQLGNLQENDSELDTWIEIMVDASKGIDKLDFDAFRMHLDEFLPPKIHILCVRLKTNIRQRGLEQKIEKQVREYEPLEVFKMKCKEMDLDLEQEPELLDAFVEVLAQVKGL